MRVAALLLCASVTLAAAGQAPGPAPASPKPAPSARAGSGTRQQQAVSSKDLANGVIRGRVVRADTGAPIEGAIVATSPSGSYAESVASDVNGRFELRNLRASSYWLIASADGFAQTSAASRRPGDSGRAIILAAGQVVQNVNFALPKAGVISGVVLDERGDPLPNALVAVLRQLFDSSGQRRLQTTTRRDVGSDQASDLTDDLGQFRVWGLTPGAYYLLAAQPSSESSGLARGLSNDASFTLFPGSEAEPQLLDVGAGQELSGIALTVKQARMASIRGSVSGREGPTTAEISLVRHSALGDGSWSTQRSTGGTFAFSRVPPGRYTVFARKDDQIAMAPVVVDEADAIVPLVLTSGTTVRGRVVTDSGDVPPDLKPSDVNVTALSASDPSIVVRGSVSADGSFLLTGVPVPFRFRALSGSAQWSIESVSISGNDIAGAVLGATRADVGDVEVVLTQQRTTLTGIVRDGGKPSDDATVLVFAEDEDKRLSGAFYFRQLRPEADGRFSIRGLPPARYLAVAVDDLDSSQTRNPDILERLSRVATRVTLGHGATQVLNLRVTKAP